MAEVMARIEDLEIGRADFAIRGASFEIRRGEAVGLVGLNGAGKTTLIRALLGLEIPDAGRAELFGQPSGAAAGLARVGIAFDRPAAMPEWRVDSLGRRLSPFYPGWDEQRFVVLRDRLGVPTARRRDHLSRGQGVKLALAVALAQSPELLVLDEPSSGLDPAARREVAALIRDFMQDPRHGVLFSTHITTDLEDLADTLVVIADGRVAQRGPLSYVVVSFSVVRGGGTPPPSGLIGLKRAEDGWVALVRSHDSAGLGPEVVVDPASIDDIIIHLDDDAGARIS